MSEMLIQPAAVDWRQIDGYEDITVRKGEGIARIAINRPEVHNAFRPHTLFELKRAFEDAFEDPEVGVVILTGEGGASLQVLFRNFRALMGVMLSGEKRIRSLIAKVRQNPQFDEDGHYFARGEMILGLLCKLKKRKAQAREHLATAQRLIVPTGASPMLSRIEMALQELAD